MRIKPKNPKQIIVESEQQGDFIVSDQIDFVQIETVEKGIFRAVIGTSNGRYVELEAIKVELSKYPLSDRK